MIAQDLLAGINPVYWQFWIGLLLMAMVLFARGGLMGALDAWRACTGRQGAGMTRELRTEGLSKSWRLPRQQRGARRPARAMP